MRKLIGFLLAVILLATGAQGAGTILLQHAGQNGLPQSGGSYTGPGDITSFVAWWGFRCYSAAYAGSVADIWDTATGNTTETLLTCSSGTVNETIHSLATTCAVACEIATLYDQSGALACSGSVACNLTGVHGGGRAPLISGINSTRCASSDETNLLTVTPTFTQAQPWSAFSVADRTGSTGVFASAITTAALDMRPGYDGSANNAGLYTGGGMNLVAAATDNAFHAIGYVANNASSNVDVDGSANTGSIANTNGFSASALELGKVGGAGWIGTLCEFGITSGALSSGTISTLNTNAHAAYGSW